MCGAEDDNGLYVLVFISSLLVKLTVRRLKSSGC